MVLTAVLALSLAATGAAASIPAAPRFASIQGGETLGAGGAELVFNLGFPTVGGVYAQALSDEADWGVAVDLDWLSSEVFGGGLYRSLLWRSGATSLAWRARAGLYADFGASWAYSANRAGSGFQVSPGLALSVRGGRGLFSIGADAPFTVTVSSASGVALGLRGSVAYETPLWGDVLVGARGGVGGLFSSSGAPFGRDSPRLTTELVGLVTYRLF